MRAVSRDGSTVTPGDVLTDVMGTAWVFNDISDPPKDDGWSGGRFPGRVRVTDTQGVESQLYPLELGLHIEVD